MKKFFIFLFFYLIISSSSILSLINNNSNSSTINHLKNKLYITKKDQKESNNSVKRLLSDSDDGFTQIRIFIDKTYIDKQKSDNLNNYNKAIASIEKCVNTIQKLVKVKKSNKIKFSDSDIATLSLNSNDLDQNLLSSGNGIDADLIIIPKFIENNSIIALGKPLIFDSETKRPIGAILSLNKNLPQIENNENYLDSIILHQFTHILGFLYDLFNNFPGGITNVIKTQTEARRNKEKKYIITPKVVSYAQKYFNCDSITGVELEGGEGYDGQRNSHWEGRVLLGEYMISEIYTPEQAISGFTLALLEDSGWYKMNYYTGGLMRFGKNKGCAFLDEDCEVNEISNNKFKNEFFTAHSSELYRPTCSSGRQSRSYNMNKRGADRGLPISGKTIADNCFVSDFEPTEENLKFYVGSCRRGGGEYGYNIVYNDNNLNIKNGDFPEIFGEKISLNSFCILSSAIPLLSILGNTAQYNIFQDVIHPMCYPMFCTEKSLTIQIYNQYIVCPREGGIVEIKGDFSGLIYCPDYNLICTGTVMCNDMFDCVEKESLEKSDTYIYDYEIKTSQTRINENNLNENDLSIGYELNDDGKCPQHCSQCKEHRKCFICEEDYVLIGSKENDNNPIICVQNPNLDNYYKNQNDDIYYLCMDNCLTCSSGDTCNNCDLKYKLNSDNKCEEKIPHCNIFDTNYENCIECEDNYYLLNDDKTHCYNEEIEEDEYFTEDGGKTYINCDNAIDNCLKCNGRVYCNECKNGYKLTNENKECILKIDHCKIFDSNYEFCEECDDGYYLINEDKSECHNEPIDNEKFFTEDEGKTYTNCESAIDNCLKCNGRNSCTQCKDAYKLNNQNKECILKITYCKTFDSNYEFCEECDDGYYLINEDKSECHNEPIDNEKYFTEDEGKTYTNCESAIDNCIKCYNGNECYLCKNGFLLENGNTECNSIIPNCIKFEINYDNCKECQEGYYLLNEDKSECHNEPIDTEKYFTEDEGKTYTNCEQAIENCIKCNGRNSCTQCINTYKIDQNGKICSPKIPNCKTFDSNYERCEECDDNYYFLNNDFTKCYNNPIDDSYFTEDDGKIYISCDKVIENCDKCRGRNNCILCKEGYIIDKDNTICSLIDDPNLKCDINIKNIDDKDMSYLKEEIINNLVHEYISNNLDTKGVVEHYKNGMYNYSITIFKTPQCTKNLLFSGGYYLNTTNILLMYGKGYLINCFIAYNSKNIINFYKNDGEQINLKENCPQCIELKYDLINNFSDNYLNYYSPLLIEKIKEEEIDIFSNENKNLTDKCNSFEYGGLNVPVKIREKIFYSNDNMEGFFCTDQYCTINSKNISDFLADCNCKINYEINYLLNDINKFNNNDNLDEYISSDSSLNSLGIFSCFFKGNSDNLLQTFALYFSSSCALIEIISFVTYLVFKQKINLQKYSPKKKENNEINEKKDENNENKENNENNENNESLKEKELNQVETLDKDNNLIPTEENIRPSVSSVEKLTNNPPPKNSIFYKYRWFKNKPKILSLENSHDEDLEIQSRDEGDPQNEIMRKIKNISFFDKNSSDYNSSYLDDTISDRDKKTETSKNKLTLVSDGKNKKIVEEKKEEEEKQFTNVKNKKELEIHEFSPKKEIKFQPLKINLPQVLTREENARRKRRVHSIKNTPKETTVNIPKKPVEEKKIKKPIEIYLDVLCIKQHIINFFSCLFNKCLEAESFIPLQMKIIRFVFLIILNIFFNTIFLGQNYFIEKYNYFNDKYNLEKEAKKELIISDSEKINYAFKHCFKNAFISFILCLIIQLIIGFIFFGTKKKISNIIEIKEKTSQEKEYNNVMSKIKSLFIVFFIINFVLLILFSTYIIGFNMIYNKSLSDFLIPSFITFILLQIIPFITSIIITIIMHSGLKKENQKYINIAKTLLF